MSGRVLRVCLAWRLSHCLDAARTHETLSACDVFSCPRVGHRYMLVKGLMLSTLGLIKLSYCKKSLGIDGSACQTMGAIAQAPWAIKGAIGVLSDAYPLLGYHKASYIMVAATMGTCAFLGLATLPITSAAIAGLLMFAANLEIATADLLCEGKYAELMQTKPKTGSTMVSYVWGCFQVGSMVAACFVGPVADAYDPKVLFFVLTPIAASIMIPTGLGYLGDERVPDEQAGFKTDLIRQYPYIIAFCLVMAVCAIGTSAPCRECPVSRQCPDCFDSCAAMPLLTSLLCVLVLVLT